MYAGVPQKLEFILFIYPFFDKPKSVSIACPSLSITIFYGFISLYMIIFLCNASNAKII